MAKSMIWWKSSLLTLHTTSQWRWFVVASPFCCTAPTQYEYGNMCSRFAMTAAFFSWQDHRIWCVRLPQPPQSSGWIRLPGTTRCSGFWTSPLLLHDQYYSTCNICRRAVVFLAGVDVLSWVSWWVCAQDELASVETAARKQKIINQRDSTAHAKL